MTRVLVLEIDDVPRVVFARGEGEIGDDGDDEGDGGASAGRRRGGKEGIETPFCGEDVVGDANEE